MTEDRLAQVRAQLEEIDEIPLEERPAVFERVHQALVAELNALEEV